MSLLLDALNRASRDKADAAAIAAKVLVDSSINQLLSSRPSVVDPLPQKAPPELSLTPVGASAWPSLEVKLHPAETASETQAQAQVSESLIHDLSHSEPAGSMTESDAAPEQVSTAPLSMVFSAQPVTSLSLSPKSDESKMAKPSSVAAILDQSDSKGAEHITMVAAKGGGSASHTLDGARVAQKIVRAKAPPEQQSKRRLWLLGLLALLLGAGLSSLYLGVWGDPVSLAQTMGWGSPPTTLTGITAPQTMPVAVPVAAASESISASVAADVAADTSLLPEQVQAQKAKSPPAARARSQQQRSSIAAVDSKIVACPPGIQSKDCRDATDSSSVPSSPADQKPTQASLQSRSSGPSVLEQGYGALIGGRLQEASQAYTQALANNPDERDALLGLAYIAQQQGRKDDAQQYYKQVLRQEPGNAVARSALLMLNPVGDPQDFGSSSRDVAEQNPDSAAAQSMLGHALVRQDRLAEAQLAFFRALQLEPNVARHAFNLAVALDRLRQYGAAQRYYERAAALVMQAGTDRASGFSLVDVQTRLTQLRSAADASRP